MISQKEYAELGFITVNMHGTNIDGICNCGNPFCAHPGKHPVNAGWLDLTQSEGHRRECNLGILLGKASGNLIAVDVDVKKSKNGFKFLEDMNLALPDTLTASTPSGGAHYLYRFPEGHADLMPFVPRFIFKDRGVDLLGYRAAIVAEPSSIGERLYTWNDFDVPIATAPDWIINLAIEHKTPVVIPGRIITSPISSSPGDYEQARRVLMRCPVAIENKGGHTELFKAAMICVRQFELTDDETMALLTSVYNPRCIPPWEGDELEREFRHKIQEARTKGRFKTKSELALLAAKKATPQSAPLEASAAPNENPIIYKNTTTLAEMVRTSINALAASPDIYNNGGLLGQISDNAFLPMDAENMMCTLSELIDWRTHDDEGSKFAHPTRTVAQAILKSAKLGEIRRLHKIVKHPIITRSGQLYSGIGYCAEEQCYIVDDIEIGDLSHATRDDAINSAKVICDLFSEFSTTEAGIAGVLGGLITPLLRTAHPGCSPAFVIDANDTGAGKGKLIECIGTIVEGKPFPPESFTKDEEFGKRMTAHGIGGNETLLLDNVKVTLGGAEIEKTLTARELKGRYLGLSKMVTVEARFSMYVTGNNISMTPDMGRRVVHIPLYKPVREDNFEFSIHDIVAYCANHRHELLTHVCTIAMAYINAGMPKVHVAHSDTTYTEWARFVRDCLVWCGYPDIIAASKSVRDESDSSKDTLRTLIAGIKAVQEDTGLTVRELIDCVERTPGRAPELKEALLEISHRLSAQEIGLFIHGARKRAIDGLCIDRVPRKKSRVSARWFVRAQGESTALPLANDTPHNEIPEHTPHSPKRTPATGLLNLH